jgi:DNA adenine methylase
VLNVLREEPTEQRQKAFAAILKNRVHRGGIMAPGAGLVKNGENGRGLRSRWYPDTLARRIREIAQIGERFSFIEGDGMDAIRRLADVEEAAFFVDPPYTNAARRLYQHWQIDHAALFALLSKVKGDVLLTYDNTQAIVLLAKEFGFETEAVAMKNTHHAKMTELLIGKDLGWLRDAASGREEVSKLDSPRENALAMEADEGKGRSPPKPRRAPKARRPPRVRRPSLKR